jgi:3-oxoacyl-(acyl-carrier-protein) synthase
MNIAITALVYLFGNNFDEQEFEHRDSRLMDKQTKIALTVARKLYTKAKGDEISSETLGLVLFSDAGPLESIVEYNSILNEKGYVGINPSKFPNIMSATPLSRVAIDIGAKGPCIPLLSSKINNHAFIYAFEQISAGRCRAMMLIHIVKKNNCFGCFIEDEDLYNQRCIKPRFVINEKGGRV